LKRNGPDLSIDNDLFFRPDLGIDLIVRSPAGRSIMNPLYLIVGLIALGLLVYLFLALLKPEMFG
jgi:K+-transporting ATPase KdpF subunit